MVDEYGFLWLCCFWFLNRGQWESSAIWNLGRKFNEGSKKWPMAFPWCLLSRGTLDLLHSSTKDKRFMWNIVSIETTLLLLGLQNWCANNRGAISPKVLYYLLRFSFCESLYLFHKNFPIWIVHVVKRTVLFFLFLNISKLSFSFVDKLCCAYLRCSTCFYRLYADSKRVTIVKQINEHIISNSYPLYVFLVCVEITD